MDNTNSLIQDGINITTAIEMVISALKTQANDTDKIKKLDNIINKIQSIKNIELVCQTQKEVIIKRMICPINKESNEDANSKYGSVKWLSHLLNKKPDTIYKYIKNGDTIPYIKNGRKIIFNKEEIYEWIEEGKIKTSSQIKEDALQELSQLRN